MAPDSEAPDTGEDGTVPDAAIPDVEEPDAELPDADLTDALLPDAEDTDAEGPDAEGPDAGDTGPLLETCGNVTLDPGETDVDCGGPCDPCANTKFCKVHSDCLSKTSLSNERSCSSQTHRCELGPC